MSKKSDAIAEVFMFIWEKGLRVHKKATVSKQNIDEIGHENLRSIGWDINSIPIEDDDIEFLIQYKSFINMLE
jgi:hypothetical protein